MSAGVEVPAVGGGVDAVVEACVTRRGHGGRVPEGRPGQRHARPRDPTVRAVVLPVGGTVLVGHDQLGDVAFRAGRRYTVFGAVVVQFVIQSEPLLARSRTARFEQAGS